MPKFISQVNINDEYTLPTQVGSTNQVLTLDGSSAKWATPTASGGTVSGTGTDNRIAMFDGTADIQDSNIYYAANNYVGINTSPLAPFHVYNNEDGKSTDLILESGDQGVAVGQSIGSVKFQSNDTSSNASGITGRIVSIAETATGGYGMSFHVKDGATENNPLYITRGGNIGIGTDEPAAKLDVNSDSIWINPSDGSHAGLHFRQGDAFKGFVGYNDTSDVVNFGMDGSITKGININSDGDVGIGTNNPAAKLDIEGMSTTVPALKVNAVGGDNMILDIYNSSNAKRIGLEYDNSNINFNIVNRNTDKLFTVREGGNVGIGDDTPTYKLDVSGSIRATGDVTATSDVRTKENINTINNASLKVSKLRGVEFNKIGEDSKSIGVIAQEVEAVIPEVVKTDNQGMKSVAYGNLVGLLIESNKELLKRIEILEAK